LPQSGLNLSAYSLAGATTSILNTAPEVGHAVTRARELWEQLGSPSEFLHVPYLQSRYHLYRGELDLALRLDEDLLRLGRERDDSVGLALGHASSGLSLMAAGRFASSRSHLEDALALYVTASHHSLVHQTGIQPHGSALPFLGIVLLCLGFPDQALSAAQCAQGYKSLLQLMDNVMQIPQ
jgi:hypothetical protein